MNKHQKIISGLGAIVIVTLLMLHNPISGYVKTERAPDLTNDGALAATRDLCKLFPSQELSHKDYYCDVETRLLVKDVGLLEYKSTSPAFSWLASVGNILNMIIGALMLMAFLYFLAKPTVPRES